MILFLIASGYSLIMGVMKILNLAHGALYMIGAYVGWSLAVQYGLNYWLAVLVAGLVVGLVGLVLEQGFLRRLHGKLNEQVLLTFGFVYIITNLSLWIWGAGVKSAFTAPALSGSFSIMDWSYPIARIAIILVGLVFAIVLWWLIDKTRLGAIVRAGMDDKEMAMALGINQRLVFAGVFFLGSFMAGIAGVLGAQLLGAHLELGMTALLWAFVVVIVGGMGSVPGALLGAMLIGLIDAFGKAFFPVLAMFSIYLVMVIVLVVKPSGLLGRKLI